MFATQGEPGDDGYYPQCQGPRRAIESTTVPCTRSILSLGWPARWQAGTRSLNSVIGQRVKQPLDGMVLCRHWSAVRLRVTLCPPHNAAWNERLPTTTESQSSRRVKSVQRKFTAVFRPRRTGGTTAPILT